MIAEELQQTISDLGVKYWEGKENWFLRYWTYLNVGLDVFNQFKYYMGLPIALAAVFPFLKGHWVWLAVAMIVGLPILILAGRYQMHKVRKVTQYVNTITGDIFQFKPMELTIEQVQILKEIRDSLKPKEELDIHT